ncbi:uncharacterized protein B0I36DRAFT_421557 [Microdochium trichocladiopsis]|uniref:Ferric oxidoreductase domain-containing protein n=1 Tax=Microdochium trichocladiopsis TaxID=1682393 RepID=A0A9P8YDQ1_9PEZI|nr:uncharacterized protein B0I36DRAFT_421557 [Microdochium trichocladiopsis]KAH7036005.1 hypothetical protein B0I36DRAFT_421557 [Microdochium trichocladiopsis]
MKSTALALLAVSPSACAQLLVGYGNSPYNPLCAEACLRSFSSLQLDCEFLSANNDDQPDHSGSGHSRRHAMMDTTPECFANNTPFLTSVAWCMSTKCAEQSGVPDSLVQHYWEYWITGTKGAVPPKWSYAEALAAVDPAPPVAELEPSNMMLNETSLVAPGTYLAQWNVLGAVNYEIERESTYGIVITFVTVGLPVLLSSILYLPYMTRLFDQVNPYFVWPSIIRNYQVHPLPFLLGNVPTLGQALYICALFVLNFALAGVSYSVRQPNAWFATAWQEFTVYVMYRTGAFAFTLLPLVLLFSSRNNVLLYLTNWSHSTYLLLHRWLARFLMLHVVVHSIIALQVYTSNATTDWWKWGVAATILTVVITFGSGLYIRKANYELFLISHIVLALLILVGSWYHITLWYASMAMTYPDTSGYEVWLYIAFAVWGFDRVVRIGRILKAGVRRSVVTDLGEGYVRVDVEGVRWGLQPGRHAYVYFPGLLPWRPWENHPFSVIPTALLAPSRPEQQVHSPTTRGSSSSGAASDEEKQSPQTETHAISTIRSLPTKTTSNNGITFFVKKGKGITKYLGARSPLMTLLDGPYANNHRAVSTMLRCDRVLLISGGIGITGVLPWLHTGHANVRLCWSVKESAKCLVNATGLGSAVDGKEIDVRVGGRFDVRQILEQEVEAGWGRIGVVVSGPGSLCDDVRAAVAAAARHSTKTVFELEVDAYSW